MYSICKAMSAFVPSGPWPGAVVYTCQTYNRLGRFVFRKMFGEDGKERAARFVAVTRGARVNLQKSLSSLLDQKRLRAAQREDCPAKYRKLVNGYFEALSGGKTK